MKFGIDQKLGGFSENDGTIDFYLRISSITSPNSIVVDLGAGRAAWYEDDDVATRRRLRYLKPHVKEVIAIDVGEAVMSNKSSTRNLIYDGVSVPLENNSVDLIIADYVLEHIQDADVFYSEINRILKPGGFFCARTPHKYNYISLIARLVKNRSHQNVLRFAQPSRKPEDVFPTTYKLNMMKDINSYFDRWENNSFIFRTSPAYYFGSQKIYKLLDFLHRISPLFLVGNLFVFVKKNTESTGVLHPNISGSDSKYLEKFKNQ